MKKILQRQIENHCRIFKKYNFMKESMKKSLEELGNTLQVFIKKNLEKILKKCKETYSEVIPAGFFVRIFGINRKVSLMENLL